MRTKKINVGLQFFREQLHFNQCGADFFTVKNHFAEVLLKFVILLYFGGYTRCVV
jgi:hypothetical protein